MLCRHSGQQTVCDTGVFFHPFRLYLVLVRGALFVCRAQVDDKSNIGPGYQLKGKVLLDLFNGGGECFARVLVVGSVGQPADETALNTSRPPRTDPMRLMLTSLGSDVIAGMLGI